MSYHPIYGILFFFICLFFAYFLGKKSVFKDSINAFRSRNKKVIQELIVPDASWLDENNDNNK